MARLQRGMKVVDQSCFLVHGCKVTISGSGDLHESSSVIACWQGNSEGMHRDDGEVHPLNESPSLPRTSVDGSQGDGDCQQQDDACAYGAVSYIGLDSRNTCRLLRAQEPLRDMTEKAVRCLRAVEDTQQGLVSPWVGLHPLHRRLA